MFFNSYILSIFDYTDIVWGDRGNVALMTQLQVLQNKAVRIILDLPPRTSATEALDKLRWRLRSRRHAERCAIFIFKCLNNLSTQSFNIAFNRDRYVYIYV